MQFRSDFNSSDTELDSELLLELAGLVSDAGDKPREKEDASLIKYSGKFVAGEPIVTRRDEKESRFLQIRSDLRRYSDHFGWTGESEEAKQLSIAVLSDALGERIAVLLHEVFAEKVILRLPERWTITSEEVREYADEILIENF